jgi:hypothetical protein
LLPAVSERAEAIPIVHVLHRFAFSFIVASSIPSRFGAQLSVRPFINVKQIFPSRFLSNGSVQISGLPQKRLASKVIQLDADSGRISPVHQREETQDREYF